MTAPEIRARKMIAKLSLPKLLDQWELTSKVNDSNVYIVRGWLMDELEKRNPEAFDRWIDSEECNDYELRTYMM